MLKDYERKEAEDKKELNAEIKQIRERLLGQQQLLRDAKLPVTEQARKKNGDFENEQKSNENGYGRFYSDVAHSRSLFHCICP